MKKIISDIRQELKRHIDLPYRDGAVRFFKEPIDPYGVRTPITRKIAAKYYREVKDLPKKEILKIAEELFASGKFEEGVIASDWTKRMKKQFTKEDFKTFERWLKKYVKNWAHCDIFCTGTIHYFIEEFPSVIPTVKSWAKSKNRWTRRAAAVSFITTNKSYYVTNSNLKDIFQICTTLLHDEDDLVQKGYGWLLKAASVGNQPAVFDFVVKYKQTMPRTALRYAIEHMPKKLKQQAMTK